MEAIIFRMFGDLALSLNPFFLPLSIGSLAGHFLSVRSSFTTVMIPRRPLGVICGGVKNPFEFSTRPGRNVIDVH